ncbi:GntR family transcriptional regulator [uncultured Bartonella sp.]|uniref:GntR family transcriptional regulator n=1 Tax=uncultured Bartonella sp. TaxID=104108 RepID=UPI0026385F4B|nr:GntR family transcriptional regulator [uncultured Bartonella sp.]
MRNGKSVLYEDLKRQILILELEPDEYLDELQLSKHYGLSRTPVREVLQRLAGEGYVDLRENKGARVSSMNHSTLRNFFLVAPMIYAAIGRLAVTNYKQKQLLELIKVQEDFRQANDQHNAIAMTISNNRFHEIIGEMSGNVYLQASLGRLLIDHSRIGSIFYRQNSHDMQNRMDQAVAQHDEFISAIKGGDQEQFVGLVSQHWALSRERMEMFVMPQGLDADFFKI